MPAKASQAGGRNPAAGAITTSPLSILMRTANDTVNYSAEGTGVPFPAVPRALVTS